MPDFSRDDRMPPMSQSSIPPASHTTAPRERRYSGPSDSGAKPARYPGVYQRPPPSDYYRGPSPPPQPYRWPPAPPLDEPAYPPRPPHGSYHRDWDYRYRDSGVGMSGPFPPSRTPPPFQEWGHTPERGWSPGFRPDDSRYARRDWEDRESGQMYQHGWDRPPSPGPLPPRDWQPDPYDRPSAGQPRGSPSLHHEPGWGREPIPHYERDMREDWIPPPDDWNRDDHFIPDDPYLNDPPPPGMSYGPPRARGRSFAQDRRMPQPPPAGYSHAPPAQLSPRGPSHMPLDTPNRRHPQHDRRYSGGPGYSGDSRSFGPHSGPRRQFQPSRSSFNDPNHLQSRGAKLVPRDQLLVANTSIKVEDPDGQSLSASTPAPVSATSTSPEKGSVVGKRSRADSVAAEAEPASRRPSPFASSVAATTTTATDSVKQTTMEARPQPAATVEKAKPTTVESPASVPAEAEPKASVEPQEQRVYAEPNGVSESVSATTEAPAPSAQPDVHIAPVNQPPEEEAPAVSLDNSPKATDDETAMDVEPSASQSGPAQPLSDVIPAGSAADQVPTDPVPIAADASHTDLPAADEVEESVKSVTPEPELEAPYEHFSFYEFSDDDDEDGENAPPTSVRDAIPRRRIDDEKLESNVETVLRENMKTANQPEITFKGITLDIFRVPDANDQTFLRSIFSKDFQEREDNIEKRVSDLELEYLTLHDKWLRYCAKLDEAAEVRRVKDAEAAAAAAQNVVSEPVAAQTRSTRRNPVVNTGVMADAVHSDMEMEKVMNNMRDAAAVDPDLLARPNLAKIPDMVTVTEPEQLRLTFDDENGQVDAPLDFYDFRGRASEHWTLEERNIFIEQHRIFNKRFEKIAEHLPHKTTSQCVQYYYLMKKVPAFRAQVKRGQRRRLGRGGHQGKASALMADIEKEEDGTTASPREDESIATRRSRRHAAAAAAAATSTPPPSSSNATEAAKPRRSRVVELARGDSFETDRDGTATPGSAASDSETGGDPLHPSDLDVLLTNQPLRKGGPGRGRRWAYKGETPNGNGGSVRLDGAEPSKKRPATTSYWTVAERTMLKQHLLHHGRDWNRIAAMIQTKTAIQAKNYYFNNQKELSVFVKAFEREQAREDTDSPTDARAEFDPSATASPGLVARDAKRTGIPVTIQPAPGQGSTATSATASNKANSGRGNAHYPNVIPHPPLSQPAPQQPQWAKNTFPTTKPKTPANQPQVIPTPPLPLPGPTFRAWPVTAVPPPPPQVGYAFGTFPGVAGPSVAKGNGATTPNLQRTGSASASATPSPVANANPAAAAANVGRGTTGVQRTNVNHYPGPMRYQPYPIASAKQAKPILPQQTSAPYRVARPAPGAATATSGTSPLPKMPLPRNSSGQFAPWTGEKGKK